MNLDQLNDLTLELLASSYRTTHVASSPVLLFGFLWFLLVSFGFRYADLGLLSRRRSPLTESIVA